MRQAYGQFCPVALASEVLAERWTLLIVRELLAGAHRFNDIRRGVPRLSATLLKQRLQTLEHAGVVEHKTAHGASGTGHDASGASYCLTSAGLALKPIVGAIGEWGQRWARDLGPEDLDPGWLVWVMHRRLDSAAMPPGRTVIEIEFGDAPAQHRRFWLVHRDGHVDVCLKDPGFETTVRVATRLRVFAEVWRGIRSLKDELRARTVTLQGSPADCRAFPRWLLLSVFAPIKRER
jgi:DNA-binding HxlR family transcriptional regulator